MEEPDQIGVRVDPDLHLRVLRLLVDLRQRKFRSSQKELVEMFLTELPD
jgi:hypothetical protein